MPNLVTLNAESYLNNDVWPPNVVGLHVKYLQLITDVAPFVGRSHELDPEGAARDVERLQRLFRHDPDVPVSGHV